MEVSQLGLILLSLVLDGPASTAAQDKLAKLPIKVFAYPGQPIGNYHFRMTSCLVKEAVFIQLPGAALDEMSTEAALHYNSQGEEGNPAVPTWKGRVWSKVFGVPVFAGLTCLAKKYHQPQWAVRLVRLIPVGGHGLLVINNTYYAYVGWRRGR